MSVAVKEMNDYLVNDVNRKVKRERYVMILESVEDSLTLPEGRLYRKLRYMVGFTKDIDCVTISIPELVKRTGLGRTNVFRCLNSLENKGLIKREKNHRTGCNTFWVAKELGTFTEDESPKSNYGTPEWYSYNNQSEQHSLSKKFYPVQNYELVHTGEKIHIISSLTRKEKEKNIIKKEKENLVSGEEKKYLIEKPVDKKTKESEIKADKQMISLSSGNEKNVRSDYYNNSDQGQKKESKSLENKNNSEKSDYQNNQT